MTDFNTLLAVKDLMTDNIVTAPASISVREAAKGMAENKISSIILTDKDGVFVGIITDEAIVRMSLAKGHNPDEQSASEVMNDDVEKIPSDMSIFEARKIMTDHHVRHLIVEENGKPIGLVSSGALLGGA